MRKNFLFLVLLSALLPSIKAFTYSYINFGGSLLYIPEKNQKLFPDTESIKKITQSKEHGMGGYLAVGTVAPYNAGYEIELGFTQANNSVNKSEDSSYTNDKKEVDIESLSIVGPHAFLNYIAILGSKHIPLKPYFGGGIGLMRVKLYNSKEEMNKELDKDNEKNGYSFYNTLDQAHKTAKELFDNTKYQNNLAYQLIFGTNLTTTERSMINIDYRYKTVRKKHTENDNDITQEDTLNDKKTHSVNVGFKVIF